MVSGLYPAFVLSSFKPIAVLHGKVKNSSRGVVLRKVLVVFQFAMSLAMIIGTLTIYEQMNYMLNQDLGMELDQTVVVERPSKIDTSFTVNLNNQKRFKDELGKYTSIKSIGMGGMLPGKKLRFRTIIRTPSQSQQQAVPFSISSMDYDLANTLNIEVVAGRKFHRDFQDHLDTVVLITQNGARALGFENPEDALNKRLVIDRFGGLQVKIIGILKDFHQEHLREAKSPILFFMARGTSEYYMIKINSDDVGKTVAEIEQQWYNAYPGNPFHYFFLDEYFNSYYESDRQFRDLFVVFAVFAMLIGCLGLFGLSSFMAVQRTKEIAIRKVLGSSILGIVNLLSRQFLILIGIATILTWPLVYLAIKKWLEGYAYRIELGWSSFLISGMMIVVIALLTISYHTFRSANANPVDALNYE